MFEKMKTALFAMFLVFVIFLSITTSIMCLLAAYFGVLVLLQ